MLTDEMRAAGWQSMETAPKDMSIFAVYFHEWNNPSCPIAYQFAQYYPLGNRFIQPWNPNAEVWANGWMGLEQFAAYRPEPRHA